jgi:hypothetical protein
MKEDGRDHPFQPRLIFVLLQEDEFLNNRPLSPFRGETPKPVVFVLRRTRQRSSAGGGLNFRMDDECDFAASLIKRLAPTNDVEMSNPDAWDELFLDGTDWLLGRDSLPESAAKAVVNYKNDDSGILLDDYERKRAMKIASLKSRMAADSMNQNQAAFGVAPIVAYAKSQGLYVGVSLEGSRIFTRSDVNARAYKFATGRELTLCKRYTVWQSGNSSGS